jgi:hypothetical protein
LATARLGLPLSIVAGRCGISRETLSAWRAADSELDRKIEQARMEGAEQAWRQIMKAGESGAPGAWQSTAWRLERGFPDSFARPEIQLGVQVNNQTTVNNTLVVTAEVADELERRAAPINREIDELIRAHEAKMRDRTGIGQGAIREVETSLVQAGPITLPPPIGRHPNWWSMLSRGDGARPISVEAAIFIIKTIATDVLGPQRASGVKIDLDGGAPTLRDVWEALESLCGPQGWQALVKRGES